MIPGEQESVKKIIRGENDWIISRVNPPRGETTDRVGENRNCQTTTDFLEQFRTSERLSGEAPVGEEDGTTQMTSERWFTIGTWRFGSPSLEGDIHWKT